MSMRYRCPKCKAILNPGTKIIMRIHRGRKAALILLSPQVGNYNVIIPEDFPLKKGERTNLQCPVCRADLTSPANAQFGEILRAGEDALEGHLLACSFLPVRLKGGEDLLGDDFLLDAEAIDYDGLACWIPAWPLRRLTASGNQRQDQSHSDQL